MQILDVYQVQQRRKFESRKIVVAQIERFESCGCESIRKCASIDVITCNIQYFYESRDEKMSKVNGE